MSPFRNVIILIRNVIKKVITILVSLLLLLLILYIIYDYDSGWQQLKHRGQNMKYKYKYILKKNNLKILFDFEGGRRRHEFTTVITTYSFIHCFASYHNALMTILFWNISSFLKIKIKFKIFRNVLILSFLLLFWY